MNGRILIAVGIVIVAIMTAIIYLEQYESKITGANNPTSNATQSANQSTTSLTVATDKSSYSMGDAIVISGVVKSPVAGTPVTILVLDPNNLLLQAEKIIVSPDGSYQTTIMTTPAIWKLGGTYAVSAQYGSSNAKAQTTFDFAG